MNTMKKQWETPRTEFEGFVPNMYCSNCDGYWEITEAAGFPPSTKFYVDFDGDKFLDSEEKDDWKNTDGSPTGIVQGTRYWGWEVPKKGDPVGSPDIVLIRPDQSNDHFYAYRAIEIKPSGKS